MADPGKPLTNLANSAARHACIPSSRAESGKHTLLWSRLNAATECFPSQRLRVLRLHHSTAALATCNIRTADSPTRRSIGSRRSGENAGIQVDQSAHVPNRELWHQPRYPLARCCRLCMPPITYIPLAVVPPSLSVHVHNRYLRCHSKVSSITPFA
jgi:hypothetical protein